MLTAKGAVRCGSNPIGCLDDLKVALGPMVIAGMTVTAGFGIYLACATVIGCFVAVPLLGTATVGGAYATVVLSKELWFSKDRCKYYETLCEHKEQEAFVDERMRETES